MLIYYQTNAVQKLFENETKLITKVGHNCAEKVRNRLAFIRATKCLSDLYKAPGGLHPLKGARKDQYAMNLEGGKRLVLAVEYEGTIIDEKSVEEIIIIEITDYHR